MKWRDTQPATRRTTNLQFPKKYEEDAWWTMTDIKREVKKLTGKTIHGSVAGRIAKEKNLVKTEKGIKLYHKDLVKHCVEYIKNYYNYENNSK